jgi:phage shock protein E
MKYLFSLIVLLALNLALHAEETHTKESLSDIKKAVTDGKAVLVDVREKEEWDDGHVKGAVLVPLSTLKAAGKAPEDLPKDKPLYVHCAVGARALTATEVLKKLGYDARALKPGYRDLKKDGFPTDEKK